MAYHPYFASLRPTLLIAHRGGAALAPENTVAAFRLAVERYRADLLELDVHLTRDGEIVVAHDPTLERCTDGAGALAELDWAQVSRLDAGYHFTPDAGRTHPFRGQGATIPRLVELLRAFPSVPLNIDLKAATPALVPAFAELVRREGATGRICCGSEDDEVAARLHEALPEACHFYPRQALTAFVLAVRGSEAPPEDPRYSVLDMPVYYQEVRLIDEPLLASARAAGKWINVWTIDDEPEQRRLIAEGVGGIMTDRPDVLARALGRA